MASNVNPQEYYKNLLYNVNVIGWFGEIGSIVALICSALILHWRQEVVKCILNFTQLNENDNEMCSFIYQFVTLISAATYGFSVINILVCTMLIIGITKRVASLLLPWLILHGLIFGIGIHMSVYLVVTILYVDAIVFVLMSLTLLLMIAIFFKVFFEVYLAYSFMKKENRLVPSQEVENNMPYECEHSSDDANNDNTNLPHMSYYLPHQIL